MSFPTRRSAVGKEVRPDYVRRSASQAAQAATISGTWTKSSSPSPARKHWLWRAVDQDGYVLDEIVQSRRNTKAAKRLLTRLLKKQGARTQSA